MPRRQTEVLRNLDTPLRVVGIISIKSCGVVLCYFVASQALDSIGFWGVCAGKWAWIVQNASVVLLIVILIAIERHEDEHLVPQAIAYFLSEWLCVEPVAGNDMLSVWLHALSLAPRLFGEVVGNVLGWRERVYSGRALHFHRLHPIERMVDGE